MARVLPMIMAILFGAAFCHIGIVREVSRIKRERR
jgi:hypothetical protein